MAEIVKVICPRCMRSLRAPAEWVGKKVRCKHCNAVIRVQPHTPPPNVPAPPPGVPATARVPAEPPAAAPADPQSSPDPIIRLSPRPPRSKTLAWIRRGVTLGVLVLAVVLVVANWDHFQTLGENVRDALEERAGVAKPDPAKDRAPQNNESVKVAGPPFPRRLLAVFPSQYLYANRVNPGTFDRSFSALVQKLTTGLHIDPGQVLIVSDEAGGNATSNGKLDKEKPNGIAPAVSFPKLKPTRVLVEKACTDFLAASRAQDRVLLLLVGHLVTIDAKNYFAALDSDLTDQATLIPLDWLYEKLAQCKARQKVLLVDSCRLDPARGIDRPASGPMSAELAKMLEHPPAGVEVLAPCQAEQYSYEIDHHSVFLEKLCEVLESGGWNAGDKPENALPLEELRNAVQARVDKELSKSLKTKQASFLAGKPTEQGASYDTQEPMPAPLIVTEPPSASPSANSSAVRQILSELKLPPIQASLAEDEKVDIDGVFHFASDKLTPYLPDYQSLDEVRRQADKYPLRVAVLETLKLLDTEFGSGRTGGGLRQFYPAAASQDTKNRILNEQKKPAQLLLRLQEQRLVLEKAGEARSEEKSKRWQANYDYTLADLMARIAFLEEYNLMLGRIRKDELPELEKGVDEGWRLVPREKLQSPKDVRDLANQSRKLFLKVAKDHAGTPWEVLARRAAATNLGLQWQPAKK